MPKRPRRRRKLVEIRPDEVSLVDFPANLRPFFVIKSEKGNYMDVELEKLAASFAGSDEATERIRKALSENSAAAVKEALGVLSSYREDFPPSVNEAIATLATAAGGEISGDAEGNENSNEGDVEKMTFDNLVEKMTSALSAEFEKSFEALKSSIEELSKSLLKEAQKSEGEENVENDEENKPIFTQAQLDAKVKEAVDEANANKAKAIEEAAVEAAEAAIEETLAAMENKS